MEAHEPTSTSSLTSFHVLETGETHSVVVPGNRYPLTVPMLHKRALGTNMPSTYIALRSYEVTFAGLLDSASNPTVLHGSKERIV